MATDLERLHRFLTLAAASLLVLAAAAAADDWPHWRGPHRDDTSAESSGWGAGPWPPPKPAWSASLGVGGASPLVAGGRVYTMGWRDGRDHVYCLDAATGREVWQASYPGPEHGRYHLGDEGAYSGPAATPEYDEATGLLYTLGTDGDLNCWDGRGGHKVWGFNLYDRFGVGQRPEVGRKGTHRDYGYITAPLVHRDWLLVEVGAREGNLMAFDRRTGRKQWASACTEPAGHCGGMAPLTVEGAPCVAVLTLRQLVVIRLDPGHEGETVATFPWETDFGNNVASPAVSGSDVLITSAYNRSAVCKVHVTLHGAGKVWEQPFASKVCTPVVSGNHVYWAWGRLRCLDLATGRQEWEGGAWGDAGSCILTADRKLIVWGDHGRLALVETAEGSSGKYTELARAVRLSRTVVWPHVALANGRLYCKDRDGNLACFALGPPAPRAAADSRRKP